MSDKIILTFDTELVTVKQFHDCISTSLKTYNNTNRHQKKYLEVGMLSSGVTKPVEIPDEMAGSAGKNEYFFEISGMSCANCSGKIEKSVSKLKGVAYVSVSCITNTANIIIIDNAIGLRDLIEHIDHLGYPCKYLNNLNNYGSSVIIASEKDAASWFNSLVICMIFGIPVLLLHILMSTSTMHLTRSLITIKSGLNASNPVLCSSNIPYIHPLMLLLNIPIQFIGGLRFYKGAYMGAMNGSYGMDALVVTGTTIIFVYSCVEMGLVCNRSEPSAHVFFEASGMLLLFVTIGKYIESYTKGKSATAVAELLECQPTKALLVVGAGGNSNSNSSNNSNNSNNSTDNNNDKQYQQHTPPTHPVTVTEGTVNEIALELVQVGDILKIMPGASIPADGVVVSCPKPSQY